MVIAIDGPAGAGKSTVAQALAERLDFVYLNSGAMYRAVALSALKAKIDLKDEDAVARVASSMELVLEGCGGGRCTVLLDGRDVSDELKKPEISGASSQVATQPKVREELVRRQRNILDHGDHVAEGRDIGTVVAPEAELKVFLTADEETRAARRTAELAERGVKADDDFIRKAMQKRDETDSTRALSPLKEAEDAVVIDTSKLGVDEVVSQIVSLVEKSREG